MVEIQPLYLSLDDLLRNRLFRVPQYQRAYSWQSRQRSDLFEDIFKVQTANPDRRHFMATVVGLRRHKQTIVTDEYWVIDIVDGQQRITTLVILLRAISKALDASDATQAKIRDEIDEILVKSDDVSLVLLQTNHDHSDYFADYLRSGKSVEAEEAQTLADRELLLAMAECESFVRSWHDRHGDLATLVGLLKNRLTFVFHEIGDESLVYTVFEVLNSRGLDVSWFDRVKSLLMAEVFELDDGNEQEIIDELHGLWAEIYRCIGLRLGLSTESLRIAATLRNPYVLRRTLSEEAAAELLHQQSQNDAARVVATTKWIKRVTEALDEVTANPRLSAITKISQARLLAVAIKLREDLSKPEKEELLRAWESVTFRVYGLWDNDARMVVGDYTRLAWRVLNKNLTANQIKRRIRNLGKAYPIGEALALRRRSDCYTGWQDELRYFMFRYEEHLAQKMGLNFDNEQWSRIWEASAARSIEHIQPQSRDRSYTHFLGNLTLLPPGLNSKLQDRTPGTKADDYKKTGLLVAIEIADDMKGWKRKSVADREQSLLKWAASEWSE